MLVLNPSNDLNISLTFSTSRRGDLNSRAGFSWPLQRMLLLIFSSITLEAPSTLYLAPVAEATTPVLPPGLLNHTSLRVSLIRMFQTSSIKTSARTR